MIPIAISNEVGDRLGRAMELVIPSELRDSLIGSKIQGSLYFKTKEGDPTKGMGGYRLDESGKKVYQIEHQPTGSMKRYRKINSIKYGECWEVIP